MGFSLGGIASSLGGAALGGGIGFLTGGPAGAAAGALGGLGQGLGAYGAYQSAEQGAEGAKELLEEQKAIAERNLSLQLRTNAQNRRYGQSLLDLSRPSQSASALGNLLFAQGEQAGTRDSDRILEQVLRQNLRAGSPTSAGDIRARFAAERAGTVGDRRVGATLKGIQAALPTAAGLQVAGNLGQFATPQYSFNPVTNSGIINSNRTAAQYGTLGQLGQTLGDAFAPRPVGV